MSDQLRQLAFDILQTFSKSAAEQGGEHFANYLAEQLMIFVNSFSEPQKKFQIMFGGTYFQTNKETFLRHELPKTLEYLVHLPPNERSMRLQIAMRDAKDDVEQIVVNLIRDAQEERRKGILPSN